MNNKTNFLLLGLFSLFLGALSGVVLWAVLQVMNGGITLIWEVVPSYLDLGDSIFYPLLVCMVGGVLIGVIQKRYGAIPETMHQVMATVKAEGGYAGKRVWVLIVALLLPIIFGGAIGPEAGLSGVIAALWTFVSRNINIRGLQLEAMAETGIVATLGAIFGAPLFGIAEAVEPDNASEHYRDKLLSKKARIYLYGLGVIGIFAGMKLLAPLGSTSEGLPRFSRYHAIGWSQWKWAVALILLGMLMALLYAAFNGLSEKLAVLLEGRAILAAVLAGALLGLVGFFCRKQCFPEKPGCIHCLVNGAATPPGHCC